MKRQMFKVIIIRGSHGRVEEAPPVGDIQCGPLFAVDQIREGQQRNLDCLEEQQEAVGEGEGVRPAHEHGDGERAGSVDGDAKEGEGREADDQD